MPEWSALVLQHVSYMKKKSNSDKNKQDVIVLNIDKQFKKAKFP
jgi:hypothetical protein